MDRGKKGELGIVEHIQDTQLIQTVSGDYPAVVPSQAFVPLLLRFLAIKVQDSHGSTALRF
jgi:hypothetical protein